MLRLEQVSKSYPTPGGAIEVLRAADLALERGEALSIVGPSGVGKSTLLYVAGSLETPSSGRVSLDGIDPFALDEQAQSAFRNRHVGFVFQDHCLLPQCSVLENVLVPALVAAGGPAAHEARARELLSAVALDSRLGHRPAELSGGEKQRVAIARALLLKPTLLLADEPTGNLDPRTAATVADLLLALHAREQAILIVVTHSPALAARLPRQARLEDGRLVALSGS